MAEKVNVALSKSQVEALLGAAAFAGNRWGEYDVAIERMAALQDAEFALSCALGDFIPSTLLEVQRSE